MFEDSLSENFCKSMNFYYNEIFQKNKEYFSDKYNVVENSIYLIQIILTFLGADDNT